jgi:hypothetical protein
MAEEQLCSEVLQMNIVQRTEIHFHEQDTLSLFLESNSVGDLERAAEIGVMTMASLRMMSSLGVGEASDNLARFLMMGSAAIQKFASGEATGGFQIIPYPGHGGRKQFLFEFGCNDANLSFNLVPKGFGWLARGVDFYGPLAIIGLLRHLAVRQRYNEGFLQRLAAAAGHCGRAHLERRITLTNQRDIGLTVFLVSCGDYLEPKKPTMREGEAAVLSTEFDARLSEVINFIVDRLGDVWRQFGPHDYPSDEGLAFRNEFIRFALNFISELRYPDSPDNDYWFAANPKLLERLMPAELTKVIGILHFYAATCDASHGRIDVAQFHKELDWIFNSYDFRSHPSDGWFEIGMASRRQLDDPAADRRMYDEIASIIGADHGDERNQHAWCGMAFLVRHGHECDADEHAKWCATVFGSS